MSNYLWRYNDPNRSLWPDTTSGNWHQKTYFSSLLTEGLHVSAIFYFTKKGLTQPMTLNTSESQRVSLTVKPSNAKLSGSLKSLPSRE